MRLNILSDLHLSRGPLELPDNDADVVVLAGDVARPREAMAWASRLGKPVLYVPGNHEFYGGSIRGTIDELRRFGAGSGVQVLDDEEILLEGVRFLGSTLWTDFMLEGDGEARLEAMDAARRCMRDFSVIRASDASEAAFTPADSAVLFAVHAAWLEGKLSEPFAGPTVVITHHAPSPRSIHPRFEGSPLNACFVSDVERLVDGGRARLWIHGHTHDSFDYRLNGTRVVCNPRGYAQDGVNENALFDANLVVEIG
ncbi:MAG: metallophosphoesterase [Usitatibacter sp.]